MHSILQTIYGLLICIFFTRKYVEWRPIDI